jgi:hypothetical protein
LRGGSWNNNPQNLRAARRNRNNTENRNNNIGFRVASTTAARAARITVFAGVLGSSRAVHDDNGRGKWFAPVTAKVPALALSGGRSLGFPEELLWPIIAAAPAPL